MIHWQQYINYVSMFIDYCLPLLYYHYIICCHYDGREHFGDPAPSSPFTVRANDKRKNNSGFSMFWDIINSWVDIQTDFQKKMFQEEKGLTLNNILNIKTPSKSNKPGVCIYKKNFMAPFYGGSTISRLQIHYVERVYFLPFRSQQFLVLNLSTSEG